MLSTPLYDDLVAALTGGVPAPAGPPPAHPDLYAELCAEFGARSVPTGAPNDHEGVS